MAAARGQESLYCAVRRGRNLDTGHLIAFVAVAVALNAQFTWWVYYSLRETRERLDLQRQVAAARAETAAQRLKVNAESAVFRLMTLPAGVIPTAAPPFGEIRVEEAAEGDGFVGWTSVRGRLAFVKPFRRGLRRAASRFFSLIGRG